MRHLPVLRASERYSLAELETIAQTVAASLSTIDDVDLLAEWRAQAAALVAYLERRDLHGPMLAAQRRVEARIGQLLGEPSHAPGSATHRDDLTRGGDRRDFRILAHALNGDVQISEDDWRSSRRRLVSIIREQLSNSNGSPTKRPSPTPTEGAALRVAFADPPYPGQAKLYREHHDYAGEVDHVALVERLVKEYDGWCLHTSSPALRDVLPLCPSDVRVMAWVKPFAAFKRNIPVAYAWEPVLVKACRTPRVTKRKIVIDGKERIEIMRDFISEPITMRKGLAGAKPARVCWWLFDVLGMNADDALDDLFPGTGAVTTAWHDWQAQAREVSA